MRYFVLVFFYFILFSSSVFAIVDPRDFPNNKVGVGVLSPEADIEEAASMVNGGSQWGWVTIVIKKSEMNVDRWQGVFHQLSKHKLIPIIRIATEFDQKGYWQKPSESDAKAWADFLSKLYFPTKNKYIQVYNEVNRASEWGGSVDPEGYAKELKKTIAEFKAKSSDFFVLGAPLDLALSNSADSLNAEEFFGRMEAKEPGIFSMLDGWASHSYPNPDFASSPLKSGRSGIDAYKWELSAISSFTNKDFPVFITETGWDRDKLSDATIAEFYKIAFEQVWEDDNIVAVTPFVFNFPDSLFHRFSFKRNGEALGKKYYESFDVIKSLPKETGSPLQDNLAGEKSFSVPYYIVKNDLTPVKASLRNIGNKVWQSSNLKVEAGSSNIQILDLHWNKEEILPGEEAIATFKISTALEGYFDYKVKILDDKYPLYEAGGAFYGETQVQRLVRIIREVFRA